MTQANNLSEQWSSAHPDARDPQALSAILSDVLAGIERTSSPEATYRALADMAMLELPEEVSVNSTETQ